MATDAATPTRPFGIRGKHLLIGMLVVLGVAAIPAVVLPALNREPDPELDVLGTIQPFSLIDERGRPFTDHALRGQTTIVSVLFTRCDAICPALAATTRMLQDRTADPKGVAIKFVSITVDPEHDGPAQLAAFAERYRADPARWRFVTGPVERVRALVEGSLWSPMDPERDRSPAGAPRITHSQIYLLVDGNLAIRGKPGERYDSTDRNALEALLRHARFLARTGARSYRFGGG